MMLPTIDLLYQTSSEGPNYEINVRKSSVGSRITISNPLKRMSETSLNDMDLIAVSFMTKL